MAASILIGEHGCHCATTPSLTPTKCARIRATFRVNDQVRLAERSTFEDKAAAVVSECLQAASSKQQARHGLLQLARYRAR